MHKRIDKHTDGQTGNGGLVDRGKRSRETQLLEIAFSLCSGTKTDLIILDFSKAFDKVSHERLHKLDHCGMRGSTFHCFKAFLFDRTQLVMVEGAKSDPVPGDRWITPRYSFCATVIPAVHQPDQLHCRTRLFADDCFVYKEIRSTQDCHILQEHLYKLFDCSA